MKHLNCVGNYLANTKTRDSDSAFGRRDIVIYPSKYIKAAGYKSRQFIGRKENAI